MKELLSVVVDVIDDPQLAPAISPPTQAMSSMYAVTTFEVLEGAIAGDWEAAALSLGEQALSLAVDIVVDLVPEVVSSVQAIVGPATGTALGIFGAMVDIHNSFKAREEAIRRYEAQLEVSGCMAEQRANKPINTGPGGDLVPADYFNKSHRLGRDPSGPFGFSWEITDKVPGIGILLRLLTEHQWPLIGFINPVGGMERFGLDRVWSEAIWRRTLCDRPELLWGNDLCSFSKPAGDVVSPVIKAGYADKFRVLRKAIEREGIGYRIPRGLRFREGGREIWPLYMDLLTDCVTRKRMIFDKAPSEVIPDWFILGHLSQERINDYVHRTGGVVQDQYNGFGSFLYRFEQVASDWIAQANLPFSKPLNWKTSSGEGLRFLRDQGGNCRVNWTAAGTQIVQMCDDWLYTVEPIYQSDVRAQEMAIEKIVMESSRIAKQKIQERIGYSPDGSPSGRLDKLAGKLEEEGIMSASDARSIGKTGIAMGLGASAALALGIFMMKRRGR